MATTATADQSNGQTSNVQTLVLGTPSIMPSKVTVKVDEQPALHLTGKVTKAQDSFRYSAKRNGKIVGEGIVALRRLKGVTFEDGTFVEFGPVHRSQINVNPKTGKTSGGNLCRTASLIARVGEAPEPFQHQISATLLNKVVAGEAVEVLQIWGQARSRPRPGEARVDGEADGEFVFNGEEG